MSEAVAVLEAPAAEAAQTTEIALVDLSSIAYPIWHMSGSQPDPDYTSQQIVARVRGADGESSEGGDLLRLRQIVPQ
jgi:hypothetical protein